MDELKLWDWAVKNGYALPVIIWFLWDKGKAIYRKKTGKWVSLESIGETIDANEEKVKSLDEKLERHLDKEREEDIVIANIKSEQKHLREKFEDLKETFSKLEDNQKDAFQLIGRIKDHLMK